MRSLVVLVVLAAFWLAPHAACASVGFQRVEIVDPVAEPIEVGIWYLTAAPAAPSRLELFEQHVAAGAPVIGASLPPIVISHGHRGLASVQQPTQIWRAEYDRMLPHPHYAEPVRRAPPRAPEMRVARNAGHCGFLSPCSASLAAEAPAICASGENLNRARFHRNFNREVVEFFQEALSAQLLFSDGDVGGHRAMTTHMIGTREEWLAARVELLEAEKELTQRGDEVARRRQELPWVRIDKKYRFETDEGSASLADLFRGRSQLLLYSFMFGPDFKSGCPSCSAIADGFNGIFVHLENHDVAFWTVSRAPLAKLQAYKHRMGWTFPWASSFESDFSFDFNTAFTEQQQREGGIEFNYQREAPLQSRGGENPEIPSRSTPDGPAKAAAMTGTDVATYARDRMGMSAFALEDGIVYHTYSTYSRGVDALWGVYQWLDRAPRGRNETGFWWRRHDEYGQD